MFKKFLEWIVNQMCVGETSVQPAAPFDFRAGYYPGPGYEGTGLYVLLVVEMRHAADGWYQNLLLQRGCDSRVPTPVGDAIYYRGMASREAVLRFLDSNSTWSESEVSRRALEKCACGLPVVLFRGGRVEVL